jgi:hypothetical protein
MMATGQVNHLSDHKFLGCTNMVVGVKPIDQILHLQRIVKLPNVYNASMNATSPVNPRVIAPAQNPIREQPEGLKMRFRPIGFGRGRTGNIGSSSLEGSATESASDEEMLDAPAFRRPLSTEKDMSSDSAESSSSSEVDGDMTDAAAPTPKRAAKEVVRTTDTLLKRKHSEGADKQSKKSSSISTTTPDNMQLKRFKTKQTEYQKNMADRQSVSTKVHKSDTSITPGSFGSQVKSSELPPPIGILSFTNPPPSSAVPALTSSAPSGKSSELAASNRTFKTVKPSSSSPIRPATIKVSPIPPPWPRLTQPQFSQSSQTLDKQESPMKSESMRKDRGSKKTPVRDEKSELSLQELTRATDPNLTGEERQEEIRRLKTASKAKRRETTKSPGERIVDVPKTIPVPPPPPKSQSRPQNQSSSPTYIRTSSAGNIVSRGKSRRNSRIQRPI